MTKTNSEDEIPLEARSFEFSTITDFFRQKAEKELRETGKKRTECMQKLRELLLDEKDKKLANTADELMLRCLRTKKFNVHKALHILKRHIAHKTKYPHLYDDNLPDYMYTIRDENILNFLPSRAPDGCVIWVAKFGLWDPSRAPFDGLLKFGFFCVEKASKNEVSQICGIHTVLDCKGLGLHHLLHVTPARIRCFITGLQDCFPLRDKAFHILNQPAIFNILFAIARPLLSKKTKDRIHLHGEDLDSLHRILPPDILPDEYGGNLGPFQNAKFSAQLFEDR